MSWHVIFTKKAAKDYRGLDKAIRARVDSLISNLSSDPFTSNIKKLKGSKEQYRGRVGPYRVIYRPMTMEKVIEVQRILRRDKAYR